MTAHFKALGQLVHVGMMKIRISGFWIRKSGKTGNPEKNHVTTHFKALGQLVDVDTLKIRISGFRIQKIRETDRRATTREYYLKMSVFDKSQCYLH